MNRIAYLPALMFILLSCKNSSKNKNTQQSPTTGARDISGCYRMIVKNDTAELNIVKNVQKLEGQLSYHRQEKDDNDGTFTGEFISDSVVLIYYSFASEGIRSVRQMVFKIRDSVILQGYGEEHQRLDTAFLRDPKLAVYDSKHPFRRGCD